MNPHKALIMITYLLALLPSMAIATEPPGQQTPVVSVINMELPVHQQKKLHPELSDPVLGDQAQIAEWAWSPQYADNGLRNLKFANDAAFATKRAA